MSFLTTAYLMEKHGLRLDLEALAKELDTTPANLRRRISLEDFEIPTYLDGGRRWADVRDVAAYLDERRAQALKAHRPARDASLPA
jgi:hypothetical protein